jgi:endonuclease/exonuclease/phosphatase family metal-dependent hydrolase
VRILSWNIQSGLGCDNIRDLGRVVKYLKRAEPDVICLQEVARFIPEYCPDGQSDQVAMLCSAFPDFTPAWGTGMSWWQKDQPPQEFGNLTLARAAILDHRVHPLPRPAGDGHPQMDRVATEVILPTSCGPLRLLNTHIAYHNRAETQSQVEFICRLQEREIANSKRPPTQRSGSYANRYRTASAIVCGDFNLTPSEPCYRILDESDFSDGWRICNPAASHLPTCGIHDRKSWPEGPHCRDYFWISGDLTRQVSQLFIDQQTDLSDHQPLVLTMNFELNSMLNGDPS